MAVVNELALVNEPVPDDVQVTPALLLADEPAVMFTAPVFEQVVIAVPALTVGAALIVTVLVDVTFEQPVFPVAVSVNVTLPAVMSAADGS